MRKLWNRIRRAWLSYWVNDEYDNTKCHLSQYDKRTLLYGAFMICCYTVTLCCFAIGVNNMWVSDDNEKIVGELMSVIATYMASATNDEYNEIAETIRHDLVFSKYGQDIANYIKYIPNTAESCCLYKEIFLSQIYLVCSNSGEFYSLDLFDKKVNQGARDHDYTNMSFGYDEVSQTCIYIMKNPEQKEGSVTMKRGRGIVSVHRMKSLFCDDCINDILNTVENKLISEFVIFDSDKKIFYPVEEGKMTIGDYILRVEYDESEYQIMIEYVG